MSEPNRLTVAGEGAARARVEAIFARLDELGPLSTRLGVPQRDMEEREIALNELEHVADGHGRGELLDEARERVRDALFAESANLFPAAVYGMNPMSSGPVEDRVATISAIEDAVAVAVTEDLLDGRTAATLADPGRAILGLSPLDLPTREPAEGGLDGEPAEAEGDASDDEVAEDETDAVVGGDPRVQRAALFVVLAAIAIPAVASVEFGPGVLFLGIVVAAIALLAWLFS